MMTLLFFGACLGHVALWVTHHNWWYGQALPRKAGGILHLSHGLIVVAFPIWLLCTWGLGLTGLFDLPTGALWPPTGQALLAGYVLLCAFIGCVIVPADVLVRLCRKGPAEQTASRVINVARELGYKPVGNGRHRLAARLPFNEVFHVEMAERTLRLPRLPAAWDGLTVLHLTDLHLGGTPDREWYTYIMDRCAGWRPDLVAITGDVADSYKHMRWMLPVLGRLRWNVAAFGILGNHDHWYEPALVRRRMRRLGIHTPANAWEQIDVRGQPLVVIGHEGPWLKPAPDLTACPQGPFRLCLSHTPDNVPWARRNAIDLMLSGHVHGGQVRFPLVGSVLVPSRYGRRYDCGTFALGPTVLHVGRGLGGEHPLRFRCPPEVVLLTLRQG